MQDLRIAAIQVDLVWEDREKNFVQFAQKLEPLAGAYDLAVLPEMFTTGFSMNASALAEEHKGPTLEWMQQQAEKLRAAITGSVIIRENGHYYNRLYWVEPDGSFRHYDKRHLFSMADEHKHYTAGAEKLVVEWKSWRICPMICYDLRFPVWIRNREQYDLLLFVANWPERRVLHWRALLQARAIENQCYVAGINRVGTDGKEIYYSGNSMMIDPQGQIMWEAAHAETTGILLLTYENLTRTRRYMPFLKDMDSWELK